MEKLSCALKDALAQRISIPWNRKLLFNQVWRPGSTKYQNWAASYVMINIRKAMQIGTEQGEGRRKRFCILPLHPSWSAVSGCILLFIAPKFPTGMLHSPRHAAQADPKLKRNALCPAADGLHQRDVPWRVTTPETLKCLNAWKRTNLSLPKSITSLFFLPMLQLQCNKFNHLNISKEKV